MAVRTAAEMSQVLNAFENSGPVTLPQLVRDINDSLAASFSTQIGTLIAAVADLPNVTYVPTEPLDWPVQPTSIQTALDKLAARLNVLEP